MNMIDGADGMAGKMAFITTLGVATIFISRGPIISETAPARLSP
jgi:UDP-N-acetylmuramyl pentapeptide phosphotransferase/UDP-N-acetylglucosamine-1-phosphate transferase